MVLPNPQVLNMLNAKYIIAQNPQNGQQSVIPNPGSVWQLLVCEKCKIRKR